MADTLKLPGLGEQKKTTVYVVGGVVVLVLGVAWYRAKKTAAAVPVPTATDATGTAGTDASSGDTSMDYTGAYDSSLYGDGSTNLYGQPLYGDGSTQTIPGGYTNNPQWSQAAEDYLANTVGLNATSVQAALGKYLTGGTVTPDQQNIIEQAIAAVGYPPQSGPNGYPPSIQLGTATPSGPSDLAAPHLQLISKHRGGAVLAWTPVTGAAGYQIYLNGSPYRHPGAQTVLHTLIATVAYNGSYTVYPVPSTTSGQYKTNLATSKSNAVTVGGI